MDEFESLSHSKWECKYHVVFIPRCRRKVLYGSLRQHLGEVFRKLVEQEECRIEEGRPCPHDDLDTAEVCRIAGGGFIKARAPSTWRECMEKKQNDTGQSFWARGYFVSTVGRDESTVREYIRNQEKEDKRLDQMNMWRWPAT